MLKKQEIETARLLDFEFRHRARTMRYLARAMGPDEDMLVRRIILESDEAIVKDLVRKGNLTPSELRQLVEDAAKVARGELIRERGDPRPHRLA